MIRNVAQLIQANVVRRCLGVIDWETSAIVQSFLWAQAERIGNVGDVYSVLAANDTRFRAEIMDAIETRCAIGELR